MKRQIRNDPAGERLNATAPVNSVVAATDELMEYKTRGAQALQPQVIEVEKLVSVAALAVADDGTIPAGNFRLTPTGLEVYDGATYEEWHKLGRTIMRLDTSMQWVQGDWVAIAIEQKWDGAVDEIALEFGKQTASLYVYASVCRSIPTLIRNYSPSFSHAALVQGYNEQDQTYWLQKASENRWRVSDLRRALKEAAQSAKPKKITPGQGIPSSLIERANKARLNRVWTALQRGRRPRADDIKAIRQWLDQVEAIAEQ